MTPKCRNVTSVSQELHLSQSRIFEMLFKNSVVRERKFLKNKYFDFWKGPPIGNEGYII